MMVMSKRLRAFSTTEWSINRFDVSLISTWRCSKMTVCSNFAVISEAIRCNLASPSRINPSFFKSSSLSCSSFFWRRKTLFPRCNFSSCQNFKLSHMDCTSCLEAWSSILVIFSSTFVIWFSTFQICTSDLNLNILVQLHEYLQVRLISNPAWFGKGSNTYKQIMNWWLHCYNTIYNQSARRSYLEDALSLKELFAMVTQNAIVCLEGSPNQMIFLHLITASAKTTMRRKLHTAHMQNLTHAKVGFKFQCMFTILKSRLTELTHT